VLQVIIAFLTLLFSLFPPMLHFCKLCLHSNFGALTAFAV
jgi:hypothetical protein